MLKKDLLAEVARETGHSEPLVRAILEATKNVTLRALAEGRSVMLIGLGKLSVVHRGPRPARNLHTREAVTVPARNVAVVRFSDAVRDAVNAPAVLDAWLKTLPEA
jgi:nucleoid DNA-binding protein